MVALLRCSAEWHNVAADLDTVVAFPQETCEVSLVHFTSDFSQDLQNILV